MPNTKETIVLFPSLGMGHLIPFVELAKIFVARGFDVTIVVVDPPFSSPINSSFLSHVSSVYTSISFHRLPQPEVPDLSSFHSLAKLQVLHALNPALSEFLASLMEETSVRAVVLDMFCTSALDVARELKVPAYIFYACSASILIAFTLIPDMQSRNPVNFGDLGDAPIHFPGLPTIPASHMFGFMKDRHSELYKAFIYHFKRLPEAHGVLVNTFEPLERRAVEALTDGISVVLADRRMPPVYCIGPVVSTGGKSMERHECLQWLDAQPEDSVVFLSFGSMGALSRRQLWEIAVGLERSAQRFLWVVRDPPIDEPAKQLELDLGELMPEGFWERTRERGMVVKSWAPQAAVLQHRSVGGFVSHCGWNSILEAVSFGVPIIAWPLYAEQQMNKVFLVEEAKLAVEMKGYDEEFVSAGEVEKKVRWLMESEGGRELRTRAAEMKQSAMAARENGGSSNRAWTELVNELKEK